MHPVLFNFFGLFNIHTYGLMIAAGFLVGMQLGAREARRVDVGMGQDFTITLDEPPSGPPGARSSRARELIGAIVAPTANEGKRPASPLRR